MGGVADEEGGERRFSLSILGLINGPLPRYFKQVLTVDENHRLHLTKRWWD